MVDEAILELIEEQEMVNRNVNVLNV